MRKLFCLSAVLLASAAAFAAAPKKGSPVELNLTGLDGKQVHLKDLRGQVVVLNFWATWCVPCRNEMPLFVEAEKAWASKGVVFIGASLDDKKGQKDIPAFVKKYSIGFPIWMGAGGEDVVRLGLGEAVPDTAFLNRGGVIVYRVQGEITRPELLERLNWLAGDHSGTEPKALLHDQ
jgi:cytochrome c biogenesis protein CcmG/thiol:disulfide interchange protein DsbE